VAKSGVSEVQLEQDDFKIVIKTGREENLIPAQYALPQQQVYQIPAQPQPAQEQTSAKTAEPTPSANVSPEAKTETIKSPMIGTFYRKPSPDKEAFVKVGDMISKGQVVCVIEAMKLFNEIESDISGKLVKVLADDTSPVEYDQPLFLVEPA
jgi:acetyl-CoA carboxylase biotin carboxyl carrier protein